MIFFWKYKMLCQNCVFKFWSAPLMCGLWSSRLCINSAFVSPSEQCQGVGRNKSWGSKSLFFDPTQIWHQFTELSQARTHQCPPHCGTVFAWVQTRDLVESFYFQCLFWCLFMCLCIYDSGPRFPGAVSHPVWVLAATLIFWKSPWCWAISPASEDGLFKGVALWQPFLLGIFLIL